MSETNSEAILRAIWAMSGRQALPLDALHGIVGTRGDKQVEAFNMCDGSKTQAYIVKKLNLDTGNFSRTVSRWVDEGIVARLVDGKLLHVYPLPKISKSTKGKK